MYGYLYNEEQQPAFADLSFDKDFSDLIVWPIPTAHYPPQKFAYPAACVNISFPWGRIKRAAKSSSTFDFDVEMKPVPPPPAPNMGQDSDAFNQLFQLPWNVDYWNDDARVPYPAIIPVFILGTGSVGPTDYATGEIELATNVDSTSGPTGYGSVEIMPLINAGGAII